MSKYVVAGIFFVIFVAGLGVILNAQSVSFNDLMRSLSDMNPRVMSVLALPIIALLFGLGIYLRKRQEERMWKSAVKKTRAKKEHQGRC